jgi:GTPase
LIIGTGDTDELRSRLASALLKSHGEQLITLGAHPPPIHLLNEPSTSTLSIGASGKALTAAELDAAIDRLRGVCVELRAELTEMYKIDGTYGSWMIRLTPRGVEEIMEVRVAVVGNVDAGKSTTLGVLTRGGLDDGRGKVSPPILTIADRPQARVALFRHPHEIETGRTSSVGGEILGFSPQGQPVIPTSHSTDNTDGHGHALAAAKREKLGWEEICKRAAKVVSFIDLAGHER